MIKHSLLYLIIIALISFVYWLLYRGLSPGKSTPDNLANIIQNTISTGITAVSIALPMTVGILGYAMNKKIDCIDFLFFACIFLFISICAAFWNLFRLPGLVTTINIVSEYKTAFFRVIQLYSLLYGFVYLIIGAWKIIKT